MKLISSRFVWNGVRAQCRKWAKECLDCQRAKVQRHTKAPPETFAVPSERFSHVHVDLVGPLPSSHGFTHLLTIVDRFTRWPEAFPLSSTDTITIARSLVNGWISRYGVPLHITSDRGSQFTSQLWTALGKLYGTTLHQTTAYHPCSNGLVERFHRHLKGSLKAIIVDGGASWADHLPWVLLGIRTAPKEDLGTSPAEMVFGCTTVVPGDFLPNNKISAPSEHLRRLRNIVGSLAPLPTSRHAPVVQYRPKDLDGSKYVFVRQGGTSGPLQAPYRGPFKVLSPGDKTYKLDYGGKSETVSVDRLKPAHVDLSTFVSTDPIPRRGRPRNPTQTFKTSISLSKDKHSSTHSIPDDLETKIRKNPHRQARPISFRDD